MNKQEIEAKLAEIKGLLTDAAATITGTITTAASGLAADITALKAQIEAGASVDVGASLAALQDTATGLRDALSSVGSNLAALDAQTTQGTESTGGTGTETGGGTTGSETP